MACNILFFKRIFQKTMFQILRTSVEKPQSIVQYQSHCSLRRLRLPAHAQAHTQVSLCVQFIARAKL